MLPNEFLGPKNGNEVAITLNLDGLPTQQRWTIATRSFKSQPIWRSERLSIRLDNHRKVGLLFRNRPEQKILNCGGVVEIPLQK